MSQLSQVRRAGPGGRPRPPGISPRGNDPPEPPAIAGAAGRPSGAPPVPARGDDPPEPPAIAGAAGRPSGAPPVPARGDDPRNPPRSLAPRDAPPGRPRRQPMGGRVEADRGRGREVEALGPPVDRHRDGRRPRGPAGPRAGPVPRCRTATRRAPGAARPAAGQPGSASARTVGRQHGQTRPSAARAARPRRGSPVTTGRWNRLPAEARTPWG